MRILPQIPPPSPTLYKASSRVSNDVPIQKFHRLRTLFEATRKDMDLNDKDIIDGIENILIKRLEFLCRQETALRHERSWLCEWLWPRPSSTVVRLNANPAPLQTNDTNLAKESTEERQINTPSLPAKSTGSIDAKNSETRCPLRLILAARGKRRALYGRTVREIHHLTHDLHMRMIGIQPIANLEAAFHTHLYDLDAVTDDITFKKLTDTPLGRSITEIVEGKKFGCPVHPDPSHKPPEYLANLRAYSLQVVNETRRQQLTKRQIEVIRDEVTTVLFRASGRLLVCVAVVFVTFQWVISHWAPWQEAENAMIEWPSIFTSEVQQPFFSAFIGGIFGAFFSAFSRIGQISESGVTQGNLSVLAGAGRPIYHAPAIGCIAAAIVYFLFAHAEFSNFGPFHLPNAAEANGSRAGSEIGIAFLIGMIAGFSERLIPDIIDGFRKKPSQ